MLMLGTSFPYVESFVNTLAKLSLAHRCVAHIQMTHIDLMHLGENLSDAREHA